MIGSSIPATQVQKALSNSAGLRGVCPYLNDSPVKNLLWWNVRKTVDMRVKRAVRIDLKVPPTWEDSWKEMYLAHTESI